MTHQQWKSIARTLAGFSVQDKLELIDRIIQSIPAESGWAAHIRRQREARSQLAPRPDTTDAHAVPAPEPQACLQPIWERVADIRRSVPEEEWAKLPADGAEQLDHYIYGSPKRPVA